MTRDDLTAIAVATLANVKVVRFAVSELYAKSTGRTQAEAEQYLQSLAAIEGDNILKNIDTGARLV